VSSPSDLTARARIREAAIELFADRGIEGATIRDIAEKAGVSSGLLRHHFGSKEGLLVAVVRAVEARQRAFLAELGDGGGLSPAEQGRRLWERLADPAMWPYEKLFFEVYSQALRGRPHTVDLLDGIVESWLDPVADLARDGVPPGTARAAARLGVAVTRGLLLDLLATGDREGVDAAMDVFLRMYGSNVAE